MSVNPKYNATQKPRRIAIQVDRIPEQLRKINRWVVWNWEWKKTKWQKPPLRLSGNKGSSTDQSAWATFDEVAKHAKNFDGIGLAMGEDGIGLVGIDLDNCRNSETSELTEFAKTVIAEMATYTEVSPSRTGVKLWLLCDDTERLRKYRSKNDGVGVEVYWHGRYFTVTSDSISTPHIANVGESFWAFMDSHLSKARQEVREYHVPIDANETLKLAAEAIQAIDPDCDYETWCSIGMALQSLHETEGFDIWNSWSSEGGSYPGETDLKAKWASFRKAGISIGTLFHYAKAAGYEMPVAIGIGFASGRTDAANAMRFVNSYADKLRYVVDWAQWIVWDGKRWDSKLGSVGAQQFAKEYANNLWKSYGVEIDRAKVVESKDFKAITSFIRESNSNKGIRNFMALATSDPRIAISYEALDNNPELLNCQNGILNFETGEFSKHDPSLLLTQIANVTYDPKADCPQWKETIDLVSATDFGLSTYQQEIFGYSCVGGNPNAILPIMYGSGNNGKSTIWLTMSGLLGDYAMLANKELVTGSSDQHPTIFADLYRRRLVTIAEPEENSKIREADVKRLTGSDRIRARRMRQDMWEFDPTHTVWIASNHKLSVGGNDDGIWRRLKLIPYEVNLAEVTTAKPDFHLWLLENESSGILNWLLKGYQRYLKRGKKFAEPDLVKLATREYRDEEDTFGLWLTGYCAFESDEGNCESTFRDLYAHYTSTGGRLGEKMFGRKLKDRFESFKSNSGSTRGQRIYIGVRPKHGDNSKRENEMFP